MKAGRELDILIAEKVMGWTREPINPLSIEPDRRGWLNVNGYYFSHPDATTYENEKLPKYSTNIAAAWEVVEKIKMEKCMININEDATFSSVQIERFHPLPTGGTWSCIVESSDGESAPHAICLAALKAVGYDENNP